MIVLFDGQEWANQLPLELTLGEALSAIQAEARFRGRITVSVKVDSRTLSPNPTADQLNERLSGSSIDVTTVDPGRLALDTLSGLISQKGRFEAVHSDAWDLLATGQYKDANPKILECLQLWVMWWEAVKEVSRRFSLDWMGLASPKGNARALAADLGGRLQELQRAFDHADWVQVADILRYELRPAVSDWASIIARLIELVEGKAA